MDTQPDASSDMDARIAADRRWFPATHEQFNAFTSLLEALLPSTDKLEKLANEPSPFTP